MPSPRTARPPTPSQERAFTLTELVVIIAALGLLVILRISALASSKDQSKVAQCASNLRQFALTAQIWGHEHNNRLPQLTAGYWPWDLDVPVASAFNAYGAPRRVMYCPANPGQNTDGFWNYTPTYRVIGYAMAFASGGGLAYSNLNQQLTPQPMPVGPIVYPAPHAKDRPLLADATVSLPGQFVPTPSAEATYQWTEIPGGFIPRQRSSHLNGKLPSGGNVAMLDGHVEWRGLARLLPRNPGGSAPVFWW